MKKGLSLPRKLAYGTSISSFLETMGLLPMNMSELRAMMGARYPRIWIRNSLTTKGSPSGSWGRISLL